MLTQQSRTFVADFETTVYEGQTSTEVWAAAIVELYSEDVSIFTSIDELFNYICSINCNTVVYFHNLKFDGEFWLQFLLTKTKYKQALIEEMKIREDGQEYTTHYFKKRYELKGKEFIYSISKKGMWYSITIKNGKYFIEIRDSLKLIPCSVKTMGDDFKTKHRKSSIEYTGYRCAGGVITEEERNYIANDVLVVKEVLEIMYKQGLTRLTIGSCCMQQFYANTFLPVTYGRNGNATIESMPNLYEVEIPIDTFGSKTAGDYIRNSYRGGWCYCVRGKRNITYHNGTTADVNSLYPSMMHSESGNVYPIGEPQFWVGNYIPDEAKDGKHYYFIRVKTQFVIRPGYLPCIQVKGNHFYRGNEWLETSDILSKVDGKYHSRYIDLDGIEKAATVTLTLTQTDFALICEHYKLVNTEILDGCYFRTIKGLFDEYIDKYKEIKINSTGAIRQIAKLMLNNLYGKLATSTDSSFKIAYIREDNSLGFLPEIANTKTPGYIPIGSAITSYARNFTIRAAQKNYHGIEKHGFIYADTDSIHCDLPPDKLQGIKVDNNAFCCWKLESCWDEAVFVRQKTYAEHITHENLIPVEELKVPKDPYWEIKCAGMPDNCKNLFILSLNQNTKDIISSDWFELIDDEYKQADTVNFLSKTRTIKDFNYDLEIPGKLLPKHIDGGIILEETTYTMKEGSFLT